MNRLLTRSAPAVQLREALRSGLDALPDAELLDRFARYADHPAFEALARRHGPMVFGVCRRLLAGADADDAFQATFLVLIRKARSIRRGDRLGPWLYGVASRVALRARSRAARLAARRSEATEMIPDPSAPAETPDWLPILDAELSALPAKYRDALILCELQGATRAEAARALGLREGTLSSRLARGRDLLRKRLLKHGTLLPAGGLAALLGARGIGRATVPAVLLSATVELAKVTTGAAAGAVPVGATRLTDEVLRAMLITKLRLAGGALVALALVSAGLVAAARLGSAANQPDEPKVAPRAAGAKAQPPKPAGKGAAIPDREALQGLWRLQKMDYGPNPRPDHAAESKGLVGTMQFLIVGDVCWMVMEGTNEGTAPMQMKIDTAKNPKWIDLTGWSNAKQVNRGIYELEGDTLRIALGSSPETARAAEFTSDGDSVGVMEFRREKLPPSAGEKALVGSWEKAGGDKGPPTQRVEILDGYLFAFSTEKGRPDEWIGGKYTVDATKNPKWIDVELAGPLDGGGKVTKLYGSYEVADGRLKLALGTKRATRPLEFTDVPGVLLLDVNTTKEPLIPSERVIREAVPVPKPSK